jgi:hypothetical protein
MPYTITLTNGNIYANIPDQTIDTTSSMTLIGQNYTGGYGQFQDDNFIRLLETGANNTAPSSPLVGQLWFNTSTQKITVWTGTAWSIVGSQLDVGNIATVNSTTINSNTITATTITTSAVTANAATFNTVVANTVTANTVAAPVLKTASWTVTESAGKLIFQLTNGVAPLASLDQAGNFTVLGNITQNGSP